MEQPNQSGADTRERADKPADETLVGTWLSSCKDWSPDLCRVLRAAPSIRIPRDREELFELAMNGAEDRSEIAYEVPGLGRVVEAEVVRCKNGLAANYFEPYMRRRDPESTVIGDDEPTDQPRFRDRFARPFAEVRQEILDWLAGQELLVLPFSAGGSEIDHDALFVGPANAGFFAGALADLQGGLDIDSVPKDFRPRAIIYLAPPFRHSHCDGRQVVVHNRRGPVHEVFSLNLYPGPSAKKGVYGILLNRGRAEGWITAHASTVRVVTPYDNIVTIMHEGASGGGKTEMLEYPHRETDGRILFGVNLVTGDKRRLSLNQGCTLEPVTDDMALCHPDLRAEGTRRLTVADAETAWFLRVDQIDRYGVNPELEAICVAPSRPLVFLNLYGAPKATCLPWEHTEDAPGKPCPNPRVVLPRDVVPNIVNEPVEVDVRSFGIRTPPCTREKPTYGIVGFLHVLPAPLAWIWRLTAPRGHANPSIVDEGQGLVSEGVGSFWPFATGRRVDYANLLLDQMILSPSTRYVLMANQHVGAWRVGFNGQWLSREYLARRGGARFRPDQLTPARSPLLGYALTTMQIEGYRIPNWFLRTETQPEVGEEAYDAGARMLATFFEHELRQYLEDPDLAAFGKRIISCCLDGGGVEDYEAIAKEAPEV